MEGQARRVLAFDLLLLYKRGFAFSKVFCRDGPRYLSTDLQARKS